MTMLLEETSTRSLRQAAWEEAQKHKWIESEKLGHDVGLQAIHDWYQRFWISYCRHCRIEHLKGSQCWVEFHQAVYGRLYTLFAQPDLLFDRIIDRVFANHENLQILQWAIDWGLDTDRVIEILEQIDVNSARIEPDSEDLG